MQGVVDNDRGAHVLQVAVRDHTRLIGRLESNGKRVTEALRLGAQAMASAILTDPIDLCWQPVVYRATPAKAPARQLAPASVAVLNASTPIAETSA